LQTELSEENLTFWTDIESFRVLKISSIDELIPVATKIYPWYVHSYWVHLRCPLRAAIAVRFLVSQKTRPNVGHLLKLTPMLH
jgi:hypothetical protein